MKLLTDSPAPQPRRHSRQQPRRVWAFTLLEVMIATGIFFLAMFAILDLVSSTLKNARALQTVDQDSGALGMLAAQMTLTNALKDGTISGDFGDLYPGYRWEEDVYQVASNNLWQADIVVTHRVGRKNVATVMSILRYAPESKTAPIRGNFQ